MQNACNMASKSQRMIFDESQFSTNYSCTEEQTSGPQSSLRFTLLDLRSPGFMLKLLVSLKQNQLELEIVKKKGDGLRFPQNIQQITAIFSSTGHI